MSEGYEAVRQELLQRIEESERGKISWKIKTVMERFGYAAGFRVRQSSLAAVLTEFEAWGLDYAFPSGSTSANDYVTISKRESASSDRPDVKSPPPDALPVGTGSAHGLGRDPLSFVFRFDDGRFGDSCQDLFAAVWSAHPVCLFVEAPDEFFTLAGGVFSAILRRRASMFGKTSSAETLPIAPTFLALDELRRCSGRSDGAGTGDAFPFPGAVYMVREQDEDVRIDEIAAFVREALVPHTYRLEKRFSSTAIARGSGNEDDFRQVLRWLAGYSSASSLLTRLSEVTAGSGSFELASLFAEVAQHRDVLLERCALQPTDEAFRASHESAEHMVLKNLVVSHLRRLHPGEEISVEESVEIPNDDDQPSKDKARPDVRVGTKVWVEVETLRGVGLRGSNPFFALEAKLRRKVEAMRRCDESWLLVPSDVAFLASAQMLALARNLGLDKLSLGYIDLETRTPVFVRGVGEPPSTTARVQGTPWRSSARQADTEKITFADIAGYGDFQRRIKAEVLHPLTNPRLYEKRGLSGANGLLLYGLPGCGKSLMGRALAGTADLPVKVVVPSDLTSKWLGEGVEKIRELFDWALRQRPCLLVIDEIDGIAPQRSETNMHSDEKRQVNELLTQLDRVAGRSVTVVATTNYLRGIDTAIRRSGRFDIKIPVFPPNQEDRSQIFSHYLHRHGVAASTYGDAGAMKRLASESRLFTPSDIRTVVEMAIRDMIRQAEGAPRDVETEDVLKFVRGHSRSIHAREAHDWLKEAKGELPPSRELDDLEREVQEVFGAVDEVVE